MPARDIPGLNLRAYWELGEAGWKTGMDANMWRLSFLVQSRVMGIVNELPIDPENGDRYILVDSGSPFNNHMVVWDVDIWAYIEPEHGFIIFNNENGHLLRYNSSVTQWVELVSPEAIKEMYENNDDTNEFSNAEKTKLSNIENNATADMSAAEIKEAYESNLNTNAFTDAEKAKLAGLSSSRFLGVYPTLTSLQSAHPAPPEGSFAYVDSGAGADIMSYIWDANSIKYVPQASGNSQETPESVKAKYEANDDTNAFTDAEKAKLAAYDPDAPSLPTGGTTGQFLAKASDDDGDAIWQTVTIPEPEDELPSTAGQNGKVLGVVTGAPAWVDPPPSYPALGGAAGRVLTVKPDESGVLWKTPAVGDGDNLYPLGGEVIYNPFIEKRARPTISDFPNDYSFAGATATITDGTEGILITGIGGTEAQRKIIGRTLHSDWKIIEFGMKIRSDPVNWGNSGLVLMAPDNSFISIGIQRGTNATTRNLRVLRYNNLAVFQAAFYDTGISSAPTNMYIRIVKTDNNWIYIYYSFDGHSWIFAVTFNSVTNFASGFNRVGFSGNRTEVNEFVYYQDDKNFGNFSGFLNAGLPILTGKAGRVLMVEETEDDVFWGTLPGGTMPISLKTDSHILETSDMNTYLRMNSASNITLTVPTNESAGIPIGASVLVRQVGLGQVTLIAQPTVVLNTPETLMLRKRGSVVSLVKIAENEWDVHGDLELEVI